MTETHPRSRVANHAGALHTYCVYGVTLETSFDLRSRLPLCTGAADVTLDCVASAPSEHHPSPRDRVYLLGDENAPVWIYRLGDSLAVRFRGASEFHLRPDRIVCHVLDARHTYLIPNQLLGSVEASRRCTHRPPSCTVARWGFCPAGVEARR
jgi:hypothetical protein